MVFYDFCITNLCNKDLLDKYTVHEYGINRIIYIYIHTYILVIIQTLYSTLVILSVINLL